MDILNNFGDLLNQNIFLGIVIALIAGFVSSFSPCSLSTLPLIIGYVGTECEDCSSRKGWLYSIFFSIGIVVTFTLLGVFSVIVGDKLKVFGSLWYYILAAILIFVTLQLFGVIKHKEDHCHAPKLKKGVLGAFFLGILGGIFDSPCSTPALAVILTYTSSQGNILMGALLMAVYSIGHCAIIMIAGTSLEAINKLSASSKYMKIGQILKIIFGIITLIMALYLLYIAF
jgi:cytochrome c biogenesis protein CcdA